MSATPGESEKKSKKIASKIPDSGKEFQGYQEGQAELMGIEAQRKQLLMEQQLQNKSIASQNAIVAQAAELGAMSSVSGSGPVVAQQVAGMNPQTQAMLGKYGVGKPKTQLQQGRDVKITPNHVNITNNNIQKTTNNVTVQGNPAGSAPVVMKPAGGNAGGGNGTLAKFKTWMSNIFNRQKEESNIREKEFQRKEWSLGRSSGRIMRSLEKLGKTIGERLDPRKLANSNFSTMKALMLMVGLDRLVEWWPRILNFATTAEGWFDKAADFFGFGESSKNGGESGFSKMLVDLFGGKSGEKPGEAFKKFWWNDQSGDYGLFNLVLLKLKNILNLEGRAEAVKSIKFPKGETSWFEDTILGGVFGIVENLGSYLKDVLSALFTGKSSISSTTANKEIATAKDKDNKNSSYSNGKKSDALKDVSKSAGDTFSKNTSYGAAAALLSPKTVKYKGETRTVDARQNWLEEYDLDSKGNLTDNTNASLRQGNSIVSMLKDNTNTNTRYIVQGLQRLENQVKDKGGTVVPQDFFDELSRLGLDANKYKNLSELKNFKLVNADARKLNSNFLYNVGEGAADGAMSFGSTGAKIGGTLLGTATSFIPLPGTGLVGYGLGATALGTPSAVIGSVYGSIKGAITSGVNTVRNVFSNDNELQIVPEEFEGDPIELEGQTKFPLYILNDNVLQELKNDLARKTGAEGFSFNLKDSESTRALDNLLYNEKKKRVGEATQYNDFISTRTDVKRGLTRDYLREATTVDNKNAAAKERDQEFQRELESSRPYRAGSYISGKVSDGIDAIKDAAGSIGNWINSNFGNSLPKWTKDKIPKDISSSPARAAVINEAAKWSGGDGKAGEGKLEYSQKVRDNDQGSNDCSGFVCDVLKDSLGINLDQYKQSSKLFTADIGTVVDRSGVDSNGKGTPKEPDFSKLKPGDLTFYTRSGGNYSGGYGIGHVAMYVGNGYELSQGGQGKEQGKKGPYLVKVQKQTSSGKYVGAKSFIQDGSTAVPENSSVYNSFSDSNNSDSADASGFNNVPDAYKDISIANVGVTDTMRQRSNTIMDYFTNKGLSKEQAAGFVGVFSAESNLKPDAVNEQEKANGPGYGAGLAQWTGSRKDDIKKLMGKNTDIETWTLDEQLDAVWKELTEGGKSNLLDKIKAVDNVYDAVHTVLAGYENGGNGTLASRTQLDAYKSSGGYNGLMSKRLGYAKSLLGDSISFSSNSGGSGSGGSSSGQGFFSEIFGAIKQAASNIWEGIKTGIENLGEDPEAKFSSVDDSEALHRALELSDKLGIPIEASGSGTQDSVMNFLEKYDKDFEWQTRVSDYGNEYAYVRVKHKGRLLEGDESYEDYKELLKQGIDPGKQRWEEREQKKREEREREERKKRGEEEEVVYADSSSTKKKAWLGDSNATPVIQNDGKVSLLSPNVSTPTFDAQQFIKFSYDKYKSLKIQKTPEQYFAESLTELRAIKDRFNILGNSMSQLALTIGKTGNNIVNISQSGGPTVHKTLN